MEHKNMDTYISVLIQKIRAKGRELFGIDTRALAAMRVGFALIILFDLVNRARSVTAHYTDVGVLPRAVAWRFLSTPWQIPFHFLNGSWQFQAVLFIIAGIFALMMLVGYRTRLATVVSWILLVSLQNRNPLVLQGGDVLLRLCMFWAMFLPWGISYSWDAAYAKASAAKRNKVIQTIVTAGTGGYLLQVALVYLFAFLLKLPGKEWAMDRTAAYYALNIDQFTTALGYALLRLDFLLPMLTMGIFWLEGFIFFALFSPMWTKRLRALGAASVIMLHIGLGLSMHLGPFPWIAGVAMLGFFPTFIWDAAANWLKKREQPGFTIYYDSECGFCRIAAHALPPLFLLQTVSVLPAATNENVLKDMMERNSWVAVTDRNARIYKFGVIIEMVCRSPVFRIFAPVLRISHIRRIGTRIYEFAAERRQRTCIPDSIAQTKKPPSFVLPNWATVVAVWCVLYIFAWNVMVLPWQTFTMPKPLRTAGLLLRLDQQWNMFAPFPMKDDGWYIIAARMHDGSIIDLFNKNHPVLQDKFTFAKSTADKPAYVSAMYRGERWRKYMMNISIEGYSGYRRYYARYLCHAWNTSHFYSRRIDEVELIFMLERTEPDYRLSAVERKSFLKYACDATTDPE